MGFLKFFGKKTEPAKVEDLDLPPMPPPLADVSGDDFGSIEEQFPPLPDMNLTGTQEQQSQTSGEEQIAPPESPEQEPAPEEQQAPAAAPPVQSRIDAYRPADSLSSSPLYLEVNSYRGSVLKGIMSIKTELNGFDELLSSLGKIETQESSMLREWYFKMEDVQKKLMSMDKTLFKG
jgi:hypothetical protein